MNRQEQLYRLATEASLIHTSLKRELVSLRQRLPHTQSHYNRVLRATIRAERRATRRFLAYLDTIAL